MKSMAALILPNLALWGLILGLVLWGWRADGRGPFGLGAAGRWTRACLMMLVLLSIPVIPKGVLALWNVERPPPRDVAPDAVVVFAAGVGGSTDLGFWPSGGSMARAAVGIDLARTWGVPLIISGGPSESAPSEASVIADALAYDGAIILEETARNTWENAGATIEIARARGWDSLVLVTHRGHGRRALASLSAQGLPAVGFAAASDGPRFSWIDAVPSIQGLSAWSAAGYEIAATAVYTARGWIRPTHVFGGVSGRYPSDEVTITAEGRLFNGGSSDI